MADNQILDIILAELRDFKSELKALREDVHDTTLAHAQRLTAIETDIHPLLPNGQPGKIAEMSQDIESLKSWRWWCMGAGAVISAIIPFLIKFFVGL